MRCKSLLERLDAGGPSGLNPSDRTHALGCDACGEALRSAEGLEALLRVHPPEPSAAFTARVIDRVEAAERVRRRIAETPRAPAWQRWWAAISEEPLAVIGLALAPVPLVLLVAWPGTASTLFAFLHEALAASTRMGVAGVAPSTKALADVAAIPVLLAMVLFSLQWVGEAFGGSLISAKRAHKASTSRRKPS